MNGRDRIRNAMLRKQVDRTPWLPFVGAHGAFLIDRSAQDYLTSADLVVAGLTKAIELYQPDGLPILFDLQMEAEVLGCELHWSADGPPSVKTHPLEGRESWSLADLPAFDLAKGRFPLAWEATRRMRAQVGDGIALYGLICGPFTLATHLLGNGLFLQMADDPEKIQELVAWCGGVAKQVAAEYLRHGCDVVAIVDPMLSQISPRHYKSFVTPVLKDLTADIRQRGGLSSIFVCGDATRNLENLCTSGGDNVSVDENVDLAKLRDTALKCGCSFGGNLKLTVVLLLGDEAAARQDALRCLDVGGTTGFILAPGCDLPFNTPAKNVAAAGAMAWDSYQREVARTATAAAATDTFDDIKLPEYAQEQAVIVDCITLDSESCAPCQYMMAAANQAAALCKGRKVVVREHKIKNRAGIGMLVKLGVQNLPTICIDGEQKFISIIPDQKTLVAELEAAARRKP